MIYADSFQTYDVTGALNHRYTPYQQVSLTSMSGEQWLYCSGASLAFSHTNGITYLSYSFDFYVSSVTTWPFYVAGFKIDAGNSQLTVSGSYAMRVNQDRTLTITTPDNQRMTSPFDDASVALWKTDPDVNISGGLNRLAVYVNLNNLADNALWLNGRFYERTNVPSFIPEQAFGLVLGDPRGRAAILFKNFIYRGETTTLFPLLTHNWGVGAVKPTSTVTGEWTPSGGNNWQCASGVGDSAYNYTNPFPHQDAYNLQKTNNIKRIIQGVQINTMTSSNGSISGLVSNATSTRYFSIPTSASSQFNYQSYSSQPWSTSLWTQTVIDALTIGIRYG